MTIPSSGRLPCVFGWIATLSLAVTLLSAFMPSFRSGPPDPPSIHSVPLDVSLAIIFAIAGLVSLLPLREWRRHGVLAWNAGVLMVGIGLAWASYSSARQSFQRWNALINATAPRPVRTPVRGPTSEPLVRESAGAKIPSRTPFLSGNPFPRAVTSASPRETSEAPASLPASPTAPAGRPGPSPGGNRDRAGPDARDSGPAARN